MISKLKGIVDSAEPGLVSIDVNGVCYDVNVSYHTYYELPRPTEPVVLHTHLIVREDAHILFGFHKKAERSMFLALLKLNGVGPKLAITILSGLNLNELVTAIRDEDVKTLCKIPGVGKKSAERMVMEMKDRIDALNLALPGSGVTKANEPKVDPERNDAEQALVSLGYKEKDAIKAIGEVYASGKSVDQLIKDALKHLI